MREPPTGRLGDAEQLRSGGGGRGDHHRSAAPAVTDAVAPAIADASPTTTPEDVPTTVVQTVERSGAPADAAPPIGEPISISIPDLDLQSPLVPSGTLADGTMEVPTDPAIAGWFTGGPRPGERGPAVIMGHVDSKRGPGVFYRLRDIQPGSTVLVTTADTEISFTVQGVERFAKDEFPTDRVYGSVPEPALRLITCGGSFDRSIGHYRDNIVVFLARSSTP